MARRVNDLGRDSVGRLLARLALPAITAQLINALYNIGSEKLCIIGVPVNVGGVVAVGFGVENITVTNPFCQVGQRCAPAF